MLKKTIVAGTVEYMTREAVIEAIYPMDHQQEI
jgi:hypothetical protein